MRLPFLAALLIGAASAADASSPSPPLCRVEANATPSFLLGTYTIFVKTTTTLNGQPCPADGYANVRLESGRVYPWRTVTPDSPTTYYGTPFYWRAAWESQSGRVYTINIHGLSSPFAPGAQP
jgi:hypothetical protein